MNPSDDSPRKRQRKRPCAPGPDEDPGTKMFCADLRAARKRRKMGFKELSYLTGYHSDWLQDVENGYVKVGLHLALLLGAILHLDLNKYRFLSRAKQENHSKGKLKNTVYPPVSCACDLTP